MDNGPDQPLAAFSTGLTLVVYALWAGTFLAIKIGLLDMPPFGSAVLRFFLTAVVLWGWARTQHVPLLYPWPQTRVLVAVAFLFFCGNLLLDAGTARTTASRATVLFYTHPVFLALLAQYLLPGAALTFPQRCGVVFTLIGVSVWELPHGGRGHASTAVGDVLILSGALVTAVQHLICKRTIGIIHPVALVFWGTVVAALLSGIGWWECERHTTFLFSARALTAVLYLSLLSTAFGVVAFAWLQHHAATRVAPLVFLAPGLGVLCAWGLLREFPTSLQLLGVWEVCGGLCLVSTAGSGEE